MVSLTCWTSFRSRKPGKILKGKNQHPSMKKNKNTLYAPWEQHAAPMTIEGGIFWRVNTYEHDKKNKHKRNIDLLE